jgi:SAM-dependent methyltransferase
VAHLAQSLFVALVKKHFVNNSRIKVLEIGSYDVNGTVRSQFKGAEYVGADLTEGPGVDVVGSGHELTLETNRFDVAISCECFEHNPFWVETFANMYRMTAPGGLVVFTCASKGRPEHGTARTTPLSSPGTRALGIDYYRNLNATDFRKQFDLDALFECHFFYYLAFTQDLYFVGWKKGGPDAAIDLAAFSRDVKEIRNGLPQSPWYVRAIRSLYRLPVWLAIHCCDDQAYQTFQLRYFRAFRPLRNLLRKSP